MPSNLPGGGVGILVRMAWLFLLGGVCASCLRAETPATGPSATTKVSIGPFPYDLTAEAVRTVAGIIRTNANLYTVQLDNGIPWEAALSEAPFDAALADLWQRHRDSIAAHHEVYLAVAPLAEDRISWAPNVSGGKAPAWARDERRLTPELQKAYTRYVLRAVEYFHPTYLNVGVEAGDMAAKQPSKWPLFERLFSRCAADVRARHPSVKIGISFGLPLLQKTDVLGRAKKVIDESDYVGVSFYPYMSEFYMKFGAAPLPAPPDQWRKPLEWLHRNTRKPIAICETAYSSEPVLLPKHGLTLPGSRDLQSVYVADLAAIAQRDHYLFTVFFLAVDYDVLMAKLRPGDDTPKLWGRTGFFEKNLEEKPAWLSYRQAWTRQISPLAATRKAGAPAAPIPPSAGTAGAPGLSGALGFKSATDLFSAPPSDEVVLQDEPGTGAFMRWKFKYRAGQFAWAVKTLPAGSARGTGGLVFDLRSDRGDPLLLQIEESDGEAFYFMIKPSKDWTTLKVTWPEFTVDAGKKRDGVVNSERIVRIMLADAAATGKTANGGRSVDVAKLDYLRVVGTR